MKNSKRTLLNLAVVAAAICTTSSVVFADPAPTDKDKHVDAEHKDAARPDDKDKERSDKTVNKDVDVHKNATYTHDDKGWYDENHARHDYETNNGHRGYWNYENGQRVWISVDVPFVHINL